MSRLLVLGSRTRKKLIELAEQAEKMEALRESIEDMRSGKVFPVEDMLAEMRQILEEGRGWLGG